MEVRVVGVRPPPAHTAIALTLALAGALAVRVGLAGTSGAQSAKAGACFGALLVLAVVVTGWRPRRPRAGELGVGLAGGLALCLVPLAVALREELAALDPSAFPRWAVIVSLVAVAEELLLRGVLFSHLQAAHGVVAALAVTTALFAALHIPLYGWHVVPLDLAVGLWLGGLRLQSGGSVAPATAHVVADLAGWWLR